MVYRTAWIVALAAAFFLTLPTVAAAPPALPTVADGVQVQVPGCSGASFAADQGDYVCVNPKNRDCPVSYVRMTIAGPQETCLVGTSGGASTTAARDPLGVLEQVHVGVPGCTGVGVASDYGEYVCVTPKEDCVVSHVRVTIAGPQKTCLVGNSSDTTATAAWKCVGASLGADQGDYVCVDPASDTCRVSYERETVAGPMRFCLVE